MSRLGWTNLLMLGLLAALAAAHWAIPSVPTRRNFHFMPDMVDSRTREAQAPPPVLEGNRNFDFRPPEGAVARGFLPAGYQPGPEEALRAGVELSSPLDPEDTAAAERGAFVYTTFCATCHGPGGEGDGPVTRKGVPPPPSLLLPHARNLPDGQIYHVLTFGQGNMAGYASQVQRVDRWNVIRYVRQLQVAGGSDE